MSLVLAVAYVAMAVAQTHGPYIIETLHGHDAMLLATDVSRNELQPDHPSQDLCQGYEQAHYDLVSNCLHASAMVAAFIMVFVATIAPSSWCYNRSLILLAAPPTWYLPAWIGHYVFQGDIPAVFTDGTTLRGWATGEWCAIQSLLEGTTVSGSLEWSLTALLSASFVLAALVSPEDAGEKQVPRRRRNRSKNKKIKKA